jgi:hypothetical protein
VSNIPITAHPSDGKEILPTFWIRLGAGVATIGLLAVAAPLIALAVSAGFGLVALAAIAIVGIGLFQSIPFALQKLENRLLAARKVEAQSNPIEQLQNDCLRREQRLVEFRRALVTIGGKIESMSQMVEDRAHQDPNQVLERQRIALKRMRHFYECNLVRLNEAQAALDAFRQQVKQKMFEWEFAQAGQVVMNALQPSELEDMMQGLLSDEALRSVRDRFNTVFAELDVEMRSMNAPTYGMVENSPFDPVGELQLATFQSRRKP